MKLKVSVTGWSKAGALIILANLGILEITRQDIINALNRHLSELEPYDWMTEEP